MKNFITLELWQGILKNRKVSLSSFFFFFILISGLSPETVILNNNEVIKGKLHSQSEKEVVITDSSGKRTIPKDQVHKILYKDPDEKELRKILDANKAAASSKTASDGKDSSSDGSGSSGQKKGMSLGGDLFLGNYTSDWEKRTNIMYLFGGRFDSEWKNKTGLGAKLFFEYFVPLNSGPAKNYFFRADLHRLSRDFTSKGYGAAGAMYSSKYNAVLGILQVEGGATFQAAPNLRLMPKLTLSRISQDIDSSSSGVSLTAAAVGISRDSGMNKNLGLAVTLGLDFEYDLKNDLTVFGNINLFSPYFYNYSKGHQSSSNGFGIAAATAGTSSVALSIQNSSGNVSTSLTGYSLGLAKRLDSRLRIFAALEMLTINTKITGANALGGSVVLSNGAVTGAPNIAGTVYQRFFLAMEEKVQLQGLRFGIVYDLPSK